jgi:hypothetical protein
MLLFGWQAQQAARAAAAAGCFARDGDLHVKVILLTRVVYSACCTAL